MKQSSHSWLTRSISRLLSATVLIAIVAHAAQAAEPLASAWFDGFNNKARLIAGRAANQPENKLFAAIEIAMPDGWKTYWRTPGDAGGVPPEFNWDASENLAVARVLYPAPHRIVDKSGATFGYKDHVTFPVEITAKDATQPVTLRLKAAYGVCKELCVPAEAELTLVVPPSLDVAEPITVALANVPAKQPVAGRDPALAAWRVATDGGKPRLVLDVTDAPGTDNDAFVEGPEGIYLAPAKKVSSASGRSVYELDLTDGVDIAALKGKALTVTMTASGGQSEQVITLD
jgi:DsbC/DsbD-like thiol-disulfide interchange protein